MNMGADPTMRDDSLNTFYHFLAEREETDDTTIQTISAIILNRLSVTIDSLMNVLNDQGLSGFHTSVLNVYSKMTRVMLYSGKVDVNLPMPDGTRAAHVYAQHGDAPILCEVIQHGANPDQPDNTGRTALFYRSSHRMC